VKAGYLPRNEAVAAAGGVWQATRAIVCEPRLTNGQARVLLALLDADGPDLKYRPGRGQLAKRLRRQRSAIGRTLGSLLDDGWIKLVPAEKEQREHWTYSLPRGDTKCGTLGLGGDTKCGTLPFKRGDTKSGRGGDAPGGRGGDTWRVPEVQVDVQVDLHPGFEPQGSIQVEDEQPTRGKIGKPDFDAKKITAAAKAQGDRQRASGDTELVHGLGKLLGNGKADHATWCLIDRLAVGQGNIRGTRDAVTRYLLDKANEVIDDGAEHPAAAFTAKVRSMPAMARAWPKMDT